MRNGNPIRLNYLSHEFKFHLHLSHHHHPPQLRPAHLCVMEFHLLNPLDGCDQHLDQDVDQQGPKIFLLTPYIVYNTQYNILVWLLGCFFFSQKILVWLLGWGVFSQNILGCLLVWNFFSYKILAWLLGWFYFPIKYWIGYYVDFSFYRIYCFGYCVGFSFHRKYWVCYCVVVYLHIKYCFVYWSTTEIMYWVLIVLLTIHSQSVPSCSAYKIRVCVCGCMKFQ